MAGNDYMTASAVLAFLDTRRSGSKPQAADWELVSRYRRAAAVLASINDPDRLMPVGGGGEEHEGRRVLGEELVPATAEKFSGTVMLRPEARRGAIRELPDSAARQAALDANPHERTGSLQAMLESYLVGTPPPLEQMTLEQLQETLQLSVWLGDTVENLPSAEMMRQRIGYLNLLAPFEALAGDAIFRGRKAELDELRNYVGVLSPDTLLARLHGKAMRWFNPNRMPAVSVSGPGGVGKSALIARFLLEHSRLPEAARLPFSYLDFDRATLDIGRPTTLLAEMLYQLDLQYPGSGFSELLNFLVKRMEELYSRQPPVSSEVLNGPQAQDGRGDSPPNKRDRNMFYSALADMVGMMEGRLGPRPYIVVLDTFEEVQYRGEQRAFPVWEVLASVQRARPFLRVVISGRAPVQTLRLVGQPPVSLPLGELDAPAALAFLQANGVSDPKVATAVVGQVGGVPLSLKLAASLLRREAADSGGISNLSGRSRFWFSPADEEIQGQLYERLLGRIHDLRVERLAHPGLALRRISPEVILNVLNEPCRLEVQSLDEAKQLMDELRKETSLVTEDDLDGSLVHRPEVRRTMLKLLVQKEPALVEQIRRAAVDWYSTQTGWRAKAEELYQRLQLGESIDMAETSDPEIRASLQASISELPEYAQFALASIGFQVSPEVLQKASQVEREAHLAAQVEGLLPYGSSSVDHARYRLEQAMPVEHSSPLFRSMARVIAQQDMFIEAGEWIERGMRWASLAGDSYRILELAQESAWLRRDFNRPARDQALSLLGEYSRRFNSPAAVFQFLAQTYREETRNEGGPTPARADDIRKSFLSLSADDLWGVFPVLEIVHEIIAADPITWEAFRAGICSERGPFIRAEFANYETDEALQGLLRVVNFEAKEALPAVIELCRFWPYKVLHVQPPYGSRGLDIAASAAAR
jgi:hypothetical protein